MQKFFWILLCLLPSCFSFKPKQLLEESPSDMYHLVRLTKSTSKMRELLDQHKLEEFYDPEEWTLLRDNMSPARWHLILKYLIQKLHW